MGIFTPHFNIEKDYIFIFCPFFILASSLFHISNTPNHVMNIDTVVPKQISANNHTDLGPYLQF